MTRAKDLRKATPPLPHIDKTCNPDDAHPPPTNTSSSSSTDGTSTPPLPGPYFILRARTSEARYISFKRKPVLLQPIKFCPVSLRGWQDSPAEHAAQEAGRSARELHAGLGDGERGRVHGRRCGGVVEIFGMKEFGGAETPDLRNYARGFGLQVVMYPACFSIEGGNAAATTTTTASDSSEGTDEDSEAETEFDTVGDEDCIDSDVADDNHNADDDDDQWEDASSVISKQDMTSSSEQRTPTTAATTTATTSPTTSVNLTTALQPELTALQHALNLWSHESARPPITHALVADPGPASRQNGKADRHLLVVPFTAKTFDWDVATISANGVVYPVVGWLGQGTLRIRCGVEEFREFFGREERGGEGRVTVKLHVWDWREEEGGRLVGSGDREVAEGGDEEAREARRREKKRLAKKAYVQRKRERRGAGEEEAGSSPAGEGSTTADETTTSASQGTSEDAGSSSPWEVSTGDAAMRTTGIEGRQDRGRSGGGRKKKKMSSGRKKRR